MSYFTVNVYTNDAKTTLVGSTTQMHDASVHKQDMEPDEFTVSLYLTDSLAASLATTQYVEILVGSTTPQTQWGAGYIETIKKTMDGSGLVSFTMRSAMRSLEEFFCLDDMQLDYSAGYLNYLDAVNGINAAGSGATPGTKGFLSDSGWKVAWVDPAAAARSTTTTGVSSGATTVNTGGNPTTLGFVQGNACRLGGANGDFYQITSVGASSVTIHPAAVQSYGSTTVEDMGYQLPGVGDDHYEALEDGLSTLKAGSQRYHFYGRMKTGSTERSGVVEIGPLLDDSGLTAWGGKPLRDDMATNHGFDEPICNYGMASEFGYAVINGPVYQETRTERINILWCEGNGENENAVNLRPLFLTPSTPKIVQSDGVTPATGITRQQYWTGGRYYYFAGTKAFWNGNTFTYVAAQDNNGNWEFGLADLTSIGKYGPREKFKKFDHCHSASVLLANALGAIDYHGDTVPAWTFTVLHPRTSASQVPTTVRPGQKIAFNYAGQVITNSGTVTYATYPGSGLTTQQVAKISRCVDVVESYSADSGFSATYTMGHGRVDDARWKNEMARSFGKQAKKKLKKGNGYKKKAFGGVAFWLSSGAKEDKQNKVLKLPAGEYAVSSPDDTTFFTDGHEVRFTITLSDTGSQYVDFWIDKPTDGTLMGVSASATYAVFRLALANAGVTSGFYTTSDGSTFTPRGSVHVNPVMDVNKHMRTGTFHVYIKKHGHKFTAHLSGPDGNGVHQETIAATWNDASIVLQQDGAIGFHTVGGSTTPTISGLHAKPAHVSHKANGTSGRKQQPKNHPDKKHRRKKVADDAFATSPIVTITPAAVAGQPHTATIKTHQEDHDDGHYITWPAAGISLNYGEHVLCYRGWGPLDSGQQYVTLTGANGNILRFGAYWNGTYNATATSSFNNGSPSTGSFTVNGNTHYYSGPYCTVSPGDVDLTDEAFTDVEILTTADYITDQGSQLIPHHPRSGPPQIHPGHLTTGMGLNKLSQGHISRGMMGGGTLVCSTTGQLYIRFGRQLATNVMYYYADDSKAGDGYGPAGTYYIADAAFAESGSQFGVNAGSLIVPSGAHNQSLWNGGSPANDVLLFCLQFPGAGSGASVFTVGGSLPASTSYRVRFAWQQSVTIGATTRIVETPMSPPIDFTTGSGSSNSATFTIPAAPSNIYGNNAWSLVVYMTQSQVSSGWPYGGFWSQTLNTNYTVSGSTVTLKSYTPNTGLQPSFGFSSWPTGTNQADSPALNNMFQKVGVMTSVADAATGAWPIEGYWGNVAELGSTNLPKGGVDTPHLATNNTGSAGNALTLDTDGQTLTWQAIASGGGGMANPMTAQYDLIYGGAVTSGVAAPTRLAYPASSPSVLLGKPGQPPQWLPGVNGIKSVIVFNGTSWVNTPASTLSALAYDGTNLTFKQITGAMIAAKTITASNLAGTTTSGQLLVSDGASGVSWSLINFASIANQGILSSNIAGYGASGSYVLVSAGTAAGWSQITASYIQSSGAANHMPLVSDGAGGSTFFGKVNAAGILPNSTPGTALITDAFGTTWGVIVDGGDIFNGTAYAINGTSTSPSQYSVTFNHAFPSAPGVTLTAGGEWGPDVRVYANNVTNTGFTANIVGSNQASASHLYWTAVLPTASW